MNKYLIYVILIGIGLRLQTVAATEAEAITPLYSTEVYKTLERMININGKFRNLDFADGTSQPSAGLTSVALGTNTTGITPVSQGGTDSNTAAGARNNLGVTASQNPVFTGAMTITPSITITGSSTSSADSAFFVQNSISFPVFVVLNNSRISIGTTTPSTALQVIGTVTATAFSGNGAGITNIGNLRLALIDNTQYSVTGTTTKTVVYTGTINGGLMGVNGILEINTVITKASGTTTSMATEVWPIIKLNNAIIRDYGFHNNLTVGEMAEFDIRRIYNRGSATSQWLSSPARSPYSVENIDDHIITATIDTTQDMTLTVSFTPDYAFSTARLEHIDITVLNP